MSVDRRFQGEEFLSVCLRSRLKGELGGGGVGSFRFSLRWGGYICRSAVSR